LTKPGLLAVRATNQYRRRDVLAYLGLRYYLASSAARSDRWAREVAADLVMRRREPSYLTVRHFKEADTLGRVAHREIFLPSPNEALAEAALLDACARTGGLFSPSDSVFSYRLANADDLSGVYQHYMHGLRKRHEAIASACRQEPNSEVLHLDIRRFYPNVTIPRASAAWLNAAELQGLNRHWIDVGLRLLQDHGRAATTGRGHLLTGPMFSHLVGNLVLQSVDRAMSALPIRYFRYVDDITLIGNHRQLESAVSVLESSLDELDLSLHGQDSAKWLKVPAETWLLGERDFVEPRQAISWMSLIGDLKRFLVVSPELRGSLIEEFASNEIRLPVPDYEAAAQERGYKVRLKELLSTVWFQSIVRKPSISGLVGQAQALREQYQSETRHLLDKISTADPFFAKRMLPKLRYRFGRLAYLGELAQLRELAGAAAAFPALKFQSAVANAIALGDVNEVIDYGVNAVQAVAQPLRMRTASLVIDKQILDPVAQQSLAVLSMNGFDIEGPELGDKQSQLLKFATLGADRSMLKSSEPFVRELACLHGVSEGPRHEATLTSAFDSAEDIAFDAIEQEHQSS
jgi:hypothetical protein